MPRLRFALAALPLLFAPALSLAQAAPACTDGATPIDEQGYVAIGGIEQWVRIKGSSCAHPLVLLVHGGPGNPTTPWADNVYKDWEKDFTIVQWDQRGAGKTFERHPMKDEEPLVVEQLRDDGIEVARYAARRFGKRKLILMGGSWSSFLGVTMAKAHPELFCGFVSSSQVVGNAVSQRASYDATLALARVDKDQDAVARLETIGPPPWTDPRNPGILRRVMRKREALRTEPAPKAWWVHGPEYASAGYEAAYMAGEDYSWLQFVGLRGDGIASRIDLYRLGPRFDLPFYMVQGEQDLLTMPAASRRYFDFIAAPHKEFVLVPRAGHDPNPPMVAAQYGILKRIGDCR